MMIKLMIMSCFLATALAAPSIAPGTPLKREIQTPASTSKLTPVVGPIIAPIAHIPLTRTQILPQVSSPYAYSYPGQIAPIAYVPSGYSIEQHGYNIAF